MGFIRHRAILIFLTFGVSDGVLAIFVDARFGRFAQKRRSTCSNSLFRSFDRPHLLSSKFVLYFVLVWCFVLLMEVVRKVTVLPRNLE